MATESLLSHPYAVPGLIFFTVTATVYFVLLKPPKAKKVLKRAPDLSKPNQISDYSGLGPFATTDGTAEKPILYASAGIASEAGCPTRTVIDMFRTAVANQRDAPALRVERGLPAWKKKGDPIPPAYAADDWTTWTYGEYYADVTRLAKSLIKAGAEQHDSVAIFGFNSPEWHISELGAIFAGCKAAGIYPTDTADQVGFKARHSGAVVAIVEDQKKLDKFLAIADTLPKLRAIVVWGFDVPSQTHGRIQIMSWQNFLRTGDTVADSVLDKRIEQIKPTHCCGLIYTSGTTGTPKAVMISHDNIIFGTKSVFSATGDLFERPEQERIISYLPLSHVAGLLVDIICPILLTSNPFGSHVTVSFARPYDLKAGSVGDRLRDVRPTMFLGVPRVWEKISEKMKAIGKQTKGLKLKIARWAKGKGKEHADNCQLGGSGEFPFAYKLADKLVLSKVKKKLGLQNCKFGFTGAAPISKETLGYFGALGIQINEVYGMSECTGATTVSTDNCHVWGSCGYAMAGTEVRILRTDGSECKRAADIFAASEAEQGEICYRGRHIMMGYMANPDLGVEHVNLIEDKLAAAIDKEGWLHSGDKGCMSVEGMVKITGRYKELIIGAGGENIAPVPIEDNVKLLCGGVSNIMMVGDKRKFNVALVTLKTVGATGEKPGTDRLDGDALALAPGVTSLRDAMADKRAIGKVKDAIIATNKDGKCCPSNASKIQRFTILPRDFSVETDELTPTLKLKRGVAEKIFGNAIEAMYDGSLPRGQAYVPFRA